MIDIFAGPGGLGEGFSSFRPRGSSTTYPFETAVSAEMERSAHSTLQLRSFYRLACRQQGDVPTEYWTYIRDLANGERTTPGERFSATRLDPLWKQAQAEALNLTLGDTEHNRVLFDRIKHVRNHYDEMILVGGPPCQAYSVVGRARQRNVQGFRTKGDPKHFLYRQYLDILREFRPVAFIMENVKGILTSTVGNQEMFSAILRDLADPSAALGRQAAKNSRERYVLLPIHVPAGVERTAELAAEDPSAFIIRCERHGIPQARHRVIIMGIREDAMHPRVAKVSGLFEPQDQARIEQALAGLPALRSGVSRGPDNPAAWLETVEKERRRVIRAIKSIQPDTAEVLANMSLGYGLSRGSTRYSPGRIGALATDLRGGSPVVLNHEARGHMASDLARYLFCSAFAIARGRSPVRRDFPDHDVLRPSHKNWDSGVFADRFRVQMKGAPSNTITSHLSKDGHAFIHWDPEQCRSLTVREAARLQTFPDDYVFLGNRTEQFVQVGNAVPPKIAGQIASVVWSILEG